MATCAAAVGQSGLFWFIRVLDAFRAAPALTQIKHGRLEGGCRDNRGKPVLMAMFYTSCRETCPLLIDSAKGIEHGLQPAERARLRILYVSLDPARDSVAVLKSVADKRRLDPARWTLARTGKDDVRKLAALLGVRYHALANGDFNHTSALFLLDGEGRVLGHSDRLGALPDPAFLAEVRRAVDAR